MEPRPLQAPAGAPVAHWWTGYRADLALAVGRFCEVGGDNPATGTSSRAGMGIRFGGYSYYTTRKGDGQCTKHTGT